MRNQNNLLIQVLEEYNKNRKAIAGQSNLQELDDEYQFVKCKIENLIEDKRVSLVYREEALKEYLTDIAMMRNAKIHNPILIDMTKKIRASLKIDN
jgi:hypothetical protein